MKLIFISIILFLCSFISRAQLKYVIEDFEGFADGTSDLKPNGVFTYGSIKGNVDYENLHKNYSGERHLSLYRSGNLKYGGWGKGIGLYAELDQALDHLNFYINTIDTAAITIKLQDDDNGDNSYNENFDDVWIYEFRPQNPSYQADDKTAWRLVSIPLNQFKDGNRGGDGVFNINYRQGRLLSFIISFADSPASNLAWSFDFISFSRGRLPTGISIFDAPPAASGDFCSLGAWSKEGNMANFSDIALNFENHFRYGSGKKLGVVHFFQPFSFDGGSMHNFYPSVERVNKVIRTGYIPMITLEDHFVNVKPGFRQPNLYSIVEGHLDDFFTNWARQIKQVEGTVLLRILHEFNGDWYPWCIVNNDKSPALLISAYRHIHDIFRKEQVNNVKFIWCPNSMSWPQESWNFIMDAYPGDEYVDYVGLDIYNGAGSSVLWRSFRKEAMESYFLLTQKLPHKPLLICEVASRERNASEPASTQNKALWIKQMSEALSTDMSKVRLLCWFNEKRNFQINSSAGAQGAFLDYIMKNDYFKSGTEHIYPVLFGRSYSTK